ncbi:hypothetical protein F52700_2718 [Fusarium sp. NRRL 52700]|nr:hypothetical protein F52700_2718 [Fusarium sp. NRRL 52700]
MLTTLQKPKATPAAGTSQMTNDAAGPAAPPPLVASVPSTEAPSASPATPWGGLPKPKGKPQRQHYHSELAVSLTQHPTLVKLSLLIVLTLQYQEARVKFANIRIDFNDADITWIKKEQARLQERLEKVTEWCQDDADTLVEAEDMVVKLKERSVAEATSNQNWVEQARLKKAAEEAAAGEAAAKANVEAEAEAEGVEPTNLPMKPDMNDRNRGSAPGRNVIATSLQPEGVWVVKAVNFMVRVKDKGWDRQGVETS